MPNVTMQLPPAATTSLQRTYRYLRIGIAGSVLIIAIAVTIASLQLGQVLPSISAYFYTPARGAFVGALVAVSLGMLALSGRGFERAALDVAALFAPLIGLVPARVAPGTIPGFDEPCASGAERCIPDALLPAVDNGVLSYFFVGLIGVVVAGLVAHRHRTLSRSLPSLVVALGVILLVTGVWHWLPDFFLTWAHLIVSGAFFVLIAVVAFRNVWPFPGESDRSRVVKTLFGITGVLMLADVLTLVAVAVFADEPGRVIFALEFVALALFFVFWVLQTGRTWNSDDPALVSAR